MSDTTLEQPPLPTWTIGDRMAKARAFADLTQQQMADQLQIHRRSITRYETSDHPPRAIILAYAEITGVPARWIEGRHDSDPEQGERLSRCTRAPWETEAYRYLDAA